MRGQSRASLSDCSDHYCISWSITSNHCSPTNPGITVATLRQQVVQISLQPKGPFKAMKVDFWQF